MLTLSVLHAAFVSLADVRVGNCELSFLAARGLARPEKQIPA